ncbi:hypothetical protein P9J83_00770 [Clostridium sporogenes]|uniref:Uncharacterized protein n=1 Tax=Clostridium sporogenes TaxID=1509 RepID=A0AAE4FIH5_CLOSG|nr:hypothetical protein [Clostridium sporogenes]
MEPMVASIGTSIFDNCLKTCGFSIIGNVSDRFSLQKKFEKVFELK